MPTLNELLNMNRNGYVYDSVEFQIDSDLRIVIIPPKGVVLGVVGDKNVNRINFSMFKNYNGFNMEEFYIRISYKNAAGNEGFYDVSEFTVKDETLYFTWIIDYGVTEEAGVVEFCVNMYKVDNNELTQSFNTTIATGKVLDGFGVSKPNNPMSPPAPQTIVNVANIYEARAFLGMGDNNL